MVLEQLALNGKSRDIKKETDDYTEAGCSLAARDKETEKKAQTRK